MTNSYTTGSNGSKRANPHLRSSPRNRQQGQPPSPTGNEIRVDYSPFDRLEIETSGLRMVKLSEAPPNWFVFAPEVERGVGPLTFEQALERFESFLGDGCSPDRIAEIGRFENSKDWLHAQWGAPAPTASDTASDSRVSPESTAVIQGITLSPSDYCSVGCAYCYARPRYNQAGSVQTSESILLRTCEFIRTHPRVRAGCTITIGGGGDPLENFQFYRRAVELSRRYRAEHGLEIPIYLATVDPRRLLEEEEMIELILENQDWITLSVDGDTRLAYHRPRVDFRRLLDRGGLQWGASAVFTAKTARHIAHNYEYLLDAGFDAIQMIPARLPESHPLHLGVEHLAIAAAQYRVLVANLIREGRFLHLFSRLTTSDSLGRNFFRYLIEKEAKLRCGAGIATLFCDPSGRLFPCPGSSHQAAQIGDLHAGLNHLPVIDAIRERPEECQHCRILKVCGGPCTHESLLFHELPATVTPTACDFQRALCDLAVERIRELYNENPSWLNALFDSFVLKATGMTPIVEQAAARPDPPAAS